LIHLLVNDISSEIFKIEFNITEAYIKRAETIISQFKERWLAMNLSETPKFHIMLEHIIPFIKITQMLPGVLYGVFEST